MLEIKEDQREPHYNKQVQLACDVIELARGVVIADNQFLAAPMGQLEMKPCALKHKIVYATDQQRFYFDSLAVLDEFSKSGDAPTHDIVHILIHYILMHPFVGSSVEKRSWSLACDVAAEALAAEILGPRHGWRGEAIEQVLNKLEEDFFGKLTAERLYRALKCGEYDGDCKDWEPLFFCDDHTAWFPEVSDSLQATSNNAANQQSERSQNSDSSHEHRLKNQPVSSQVSQETSSEEEVKDNIEKNQDEKSSGTGQGKTNSLQSKQEKLHDQMPAARPHFSAEQLDVTREKWKRVAKSMKVDLETLSRKRGEKMGGFMRELEVTQHEQIDYRDFLRQFAIRNEDMRLSDDEFDYVFYTYGLSLYGDMPLIEPLEYKSIKRVRDFVVVIDTSSSVTGKIVQQFIDATFDVLTSTESFFEKVNIHIIQCDTQVRSDTKITSINELDRWRKNIKLYGFGGTDFRPAFKYINKLYHSGEFDDLGGVIYFTDGWGIYPEQMPPYKTAFCFYDEDHRPELVPAWAVQLTLNPGQFESMSVYN